MSEKLIEIKNLTKDYGDNRGIFGVNLDLYKGEILGFVGANGAGKTTTIRNIMGFLKPDSGKITICGYDSWIDSEKTKKYIGYVPGEIAFPDLKTGTEFLKSQAEFWGIKDFGYANDLTKRIQLDPSANLKRMSKGMKQKTAVIASLIHNPDILILDEPTTGLDPLMRVELLNILEEQKKAGKTILISSHLYEELEKIADRVALIDKGRIVDVVKMEEINHRRTSEYKIEFNKQEDYEKFKTLSYNILRDQKKYAQLTLSVEKGKINKLFKDLKQYDIKFISEEKYTLEKYFDEKFSKETKTK